MRRRLTTTLAAAAVAVVLALMVPLAILVRSLGEEKALAASTERSLTVLALALATPEDPADKDRAALHKRIEDYLFSQPKGSQTTLYVDTPDVMIGAQVRDDGGFARATELGRPYSRTEDGTVIAYRVATTVQAGKPAGTGVFVVRDAISPELLRAGVLRSILVIAAIAVGLCAIGLLVTDRLVRKFTNPINTLAQQAQEMSEGDVEMRVRETGTVAEVIAVGRALNSMQERFKRLLSAERDAVADLSHRLRTPVTALRLDTEMITDQEVSERVRTHVTQLERTVDAIVHDARRPTRTDASNSCDAAQVVRDRVAFWSALAEEQDRPLRPAVPDRVLRAGVSANDLSDVVDVLLDNVFAHTDDGVPIEVWLVPRADGAIVLTVEDGGPGLPSGDIVSRGSSGRGSSGLGLDIARRTAMASGGWLELGQSRLGGALVRVVLGRGE